MVINGQIVMQDRVMQNVSEADVMREVKAAASSLAERAGTDSLKRRLRAIAGNLTKQGV